MHDRPYILSIAGFDPSGGAGVLADIKTFEAIRLTGFGVVSALTYQNDISFAGVEWMNADWIIKQIEPLLVRFTVKYFKIGIIENGETLKTVIGYIKKNVPDAVIVVDPVLKASAGFQFNKGEAYKELLKDIYCLTPNIPEAEAIFGNTDLLSASSTCNIYLKGGHATEASAVDHVYTAGEVHMFENLWLDHGRKHGSGCVLSSALAAYLALGNDIVTAARLANTYTHNFLASNDSLLGYHNFDISYALYQ
jgi:hydroxymethylpyrimidine/phosphomethylpyrimidine kinase